MKEFETTNKDWLEDFAMFMTLKEYHEGKSFLEWEECYKLREKNALSAFKKEHLDEVNFIKVKQLIEKVIL